jgi:hypothetical protein
MRIIIPISFLLIIFLFFTDFVSAQGKDTLVKKEIGIEVSGGSQIDMIGIFFKGGFYYSRKRTKYTLQYQYYGFNHVNLDDFKGYLEESHSVSALVGYKIPIKKFSIFLNAGLCFGNGRFANQTYNNNNGENTYYFKTGFLGLVLNCAATYDINDRFNIGLSFNTFINSHFYPSPSNQYIIKNFRYLNNYNGLQISAGYKIKEFEKKIKQNPVRTINSDRLYAKWRFSLNFGGAFGFNLGQKYMTSNYHGGDSYYYYVEHYHNIREKAQWGYQVSLEVISKSFLKDRMVIRMDLGIDTFYYKGIATVFRENPWSPTYGYTIDTIIDGREYYFKDYFINFSVLPQFNIFRGKKIACYYFLGPSVAMLLKETTDRSEGEWSDNSKYFAGFGITGLGSTFKIMKGFYLDTQLRFTCQVSKTPGGRRLGSAGIRVGFMF